ncbi:hypothetical protein OG21DRAFT_1481242 [Imleria badia]|nr:hypothetical protein OG21DRAFT_1481242 [Imleria badia]
MIEVVMILRVYAMYNRSRVILGVLLPMYITQVVILIAGCGVYSDSDYGTVSVVQLLDITACNSVFKTQKWNVAFTVVQFILGTSMCILVMAHFVRNSLQTHQATRKWQLNRYVARLIGDGLLYFLVTFLFGIINMLLILNKLPQGWFPSLLSVSSDVLVYTLTPRFVMNIRKLYVVDSQGRCDIDTGFGLSSAVGRGVGGTTTLGTIVFVEGSQIGGSDDGKETATAEESAQSS